jgi:hypothetical protein
MMAFSAIELMVCYCIEQSWNKLTVSNQVGGRALSILEKYTLFAFDDYEFCEIDFKSKRSTRNWIDFDMNGWS